MNAAQMLAQPRHAYMLLHAEPELDTHNPREAASAMHAADFVVALSPFRHRAIEYADALLPIAPFSETAGSFVSTEGRLQSFNGVVRPLGETRPAWKVLRVLGNLFGLTGFDYNSAEEVRAHALQDVDVPSRLSNAHRGRRRAGERGPAPSGLQRIADVPIYFADPLVRRSAPLQDTLDAAEPVASMSGATDATPGLAVGRSRARRTRQRRGRAVDAIATTAFRPTAFAFPPAIG